MRIHHVALWVEDLEAICAFYTRFFGATAGPLYVNPAKGFESRFLSWGDEARLEVMRRRDIVRPSSPDAHSERPGWAHIAIDVETEDRVHALTEAIRAAGFPIAGEPRRTGDGYYESVVLDPEGNRVEIACGP